MAAVDTEADTEAAVVHINIKFIIILMLSLVLFNGCLLRNPRLDSDNDGVADVYDRCKNTPFLKIVDATGCAAEDHKNLH